MRIVKGGKGEGEGGGEMQVMLGSQRASWVTSGWRMRMLRRILGVRAREKRMREGGGRES